MIRYISIGFIIISQIFTLMAHEYYVSLTEMTFNPDKQRIEIISRVFHDDLENVLKARYHKNLELKPSKQSEDIESYIQLYFDKKLNINIDNTSQTLKYIGFKFEDDRINIFLKIENVEDFKTLQIQNLLLTDVIEDQKNIVHCFKPNQKKSVLLTRFDSEAVLKFN